TGGEATTRTEVATSESSGDGAVALFAEGRQKSRVVNLLTVEGEDQVTLKVTVAEIRREVVKQLGFDNFFRRNAAGSGSSLDILGVATGVDGVVGRVSGSVGKLSIDMVLSALEQANAIRTLAEPTLTAIS